MFSKIALPVTVMIGIMGCGDGSRVHVEKMLRENPNTIHANHAVILGSYQWDVDSDRLANGKKNDLYWHDLGLNNAQLESINGAKLALVTGKPFASIDKRFIKKYPLNSTYINRKQLIPGTVVVFQTNEGRYGKLIVDRYSSSHDMSSKEAQTYPTEGWRKMKLKEPEDKHYHMHVKWKLL